MRWKTNYAEAKKFFLIRKWTLMQLTVMVLHIMSTIFSTSVRKLTFSANNIYMWTISVTQIKGGAHANIVGTKSTHGALLLSQKLQKTYQTDLSNVDFDDWVQFWNSM